MPSSYTPAQKAAIAQFVGFTSTKDSVAAKHLKSHGWNAEQAIDASLRAAKTKMGSLSKEAEQQLQTIRREWKKHWRGPYAPEKTLADHFVDMECYGFSNQEEAWEEDARRVISNPAFQYCGESDAKQRDPCVSFHESTRKLLNTLKAKAMSEGFKWIRPNDLALAFRFAMRRPLMPEAAFQDRLRELGVELELGQGGSRVERTPIVGRSRQLLTGIDLGPDQETPHVSIKLKDILPRGGDAAYDLTDTVKHKGVITPRGRDLQESLKLQRKLLTVYFDVEEGNVELEDAPCLYRNALIIPDLDNETLAVLIQQHCVPVHHIPAKGRSAFRGSAEQYPFPTDDGMDRDRSQLYEQLRQRVSKKVCHKKLVAELMFLISFGRFGADSLVAEDIIPVIQDCLRGMPLADQLIDDILADLSNTVEQTALLIWGDARYESKRLSQEKYNAAIEFVEASAVNFSIAVDENSGEAPIPEPFDFVEAPCNAQGNTTSATTNGKQPLEGVRPIRSSSDRSLETSSPGRTILVHDPDVLAKTSWDGSVPVNERAKAPEEGLSDGLFGLVMPSQKAREIGHVIGLPADYLKQKVRSSSLHRMRAEKSYEAMAKVTFPRSKRRATLAIYSDSPVKAARHDADFELFAREDEDTEVFALSHFYPDQIGESCDNCMQSTCACAISSDSQQTSDDYCSLCKQEQCMCGLSHEDVEAMPDDDPNAGLPPSPKIKVILKPPSKPSQESFSVLAYLSRVMGGDDVMALLKEFEKAPTSDIVITRLETMLNHVKQGISTGKIDGAGGSEDSDVVAIMQSLLNIHTNDCQEIHLDDPDPCERSDPLLAYLSSFDGTEDVLECLKKIAAGDASSDAMESVKEILNCVQQGISTGEIDPKNAASGSKDSEVINILGNLVALHEPLQIHIDHLLDSNPLLDYLSRVMEDDAVLVSLRELASSLTSVDCFRRTRWIQELLKSGNIDYELKSSGSGGKDAEAKAILKCVFDTMTAMERHCASRSPRTDKGDGKVKARNLSPATLHWFKEAPVELKRCYTSIVREVKEGVESSPEWIFTPNPHLAYLSCVLERDNMLAFVQNLEQRISVDDETIEVVARLSSHIQCGYRTGAISRFDLGREDDEIHAVLERLSLSWVVSQCNVQRSIEDRDPYNSSASQSGNCDGSLESGRLRSGVPSRDLNSDPEFSECLVIRPRSILAAGTSATPPMPQRPTNAIFIEPLKKPSAPTVLSICLSTSLERDRSSSPESCGRLTSSAITPAQPQGNTAVGKACVTIVGQGADCGASISNTTTLDTLKITNGVSNMGPPPRPKSKPQARPNWATPEVGSSGTASTGPPPSPRPGIRTLSNPAAPEDGSNGKASTGPPPSPRPGFRTLSDQEPWIAQETSISIMRDGPPKPSPSFFAPLISTRLGNEKLHESVKTAASSSDKHRPMNEKVHKFVEPASSSSPPCRMLDDMSQPRKTSGRTSFKEALEFVQTTALKQRKSLFVHMEELRDIRTKLKQYDYEANLEWDLHRFFQNSNTSSGGTSTTALSKLFDRYRDNVTEEPDRIGVEGSMKYLNDLGVKLDEAAVLAVLTELSAPTMGELTRDGFIKGWTNHRAETLTKQQSQINSFRRGLSATPDFFRKVYKQTFLIARPPGQKVLPLETAIEYWRLLFTAPSYSWITSSTPWLEWWIEYLESKWKKSISKDMWDQTGSFMLKTLDDESMSWWSEDGAWPGVLDEFVGYVKERRNGTGTEMDVG